MNRPKILFIMPSLKAGGTEKVISYIVNELNSKSFQIHLIVTGFKEDSFFEVNKEVTFLCKSKFRYSILDLHRKIKNLKPDIVFSSSYQVNTFLLIYQSFFKIKLILRINSLPSFQERNFLLLKLNSFLFKKTYKIVFQSHTIQNNFFKTYGYNPINSVVINNPVLITGNRLRRSNMLHFITVASLTELKGHKRVIKCLSKIKTDFLYTIVGDGILKKELIELVKKLDLEKKIVFMGEKRNPHQHMYENSIYLLGSYFEGFPNSVLEALSFGIPVISFNSPGGHNEIIKGNFNGFICKNHDEFIEKINFSQKKKWDRLSIIEDIISRFNPEGIILKYSKLLKSNDLN